MQYPAMAAENVPAAQSKHAAELDAPVSVEYLPAAQPIEQAVAPVALWKLPAGQPWHEAALLLGAKLPVAQE